jgi:hypothetical protein
MTKILCPVAMATGRQETRYGAAPERAWGWARSALLRDRVRDTYLPGYELQFKELVGDLLL